MKTNTKILIIIPAFVAAVLMTLLVSPAFSQPSKWRASSPSKMSIGQIGDTLNIWDVQATNIFFLNNADLKDSSSVDSLVFYTKSVGAKPFSAQIRLTSDSGKIMGQVLKVTSQSTGLERVALAIKDFKVKAFNTVRFYMNLGDKSGWEISGFQFKEKYVAPPIVIEPEALKPADQAKRFWFFKSDVAQFYFDTISSRISNVDTVVLKERKQ